MNNKWPVWAFSAFFAVALGPFLHSQNAPVVQVEFWNPGLIPAHWTMVIHPDGSGHFRSERGTAPAAQRNSDASQVAPPDQDRDIHLSAQFAGRVFQQAHNDHWFNIPCESHLKIAFQGWKQLSYSGPEGEGSCKFNYSKDKAIQELGDSLVAVASTIIEGARLELLLHHDRLGLDQEMEFIVEAEGDGREQQIGVIQPILERLVNDPSVMDRVRKRARLLLERANQ